jgi:hypothetical protein
MVEINKSDKQRIEKFIDDNQLDYELSESLSKFGLISYDKTIFYLYNYNESYVLVKYNPEKDKIDNPGSIAYEYFSFQNLSQILEQLCFYHQPNTACSVIAL